VHPYSTDSNERKQIPVALFILSVVSAWLLNRAMEWLGLAWPWWVDAPSVMGFYGIYYTVFDKYLWRQHLLGRVGIVKVPDLRGVWKGYVTSSYDVHSTRYECTIEIRQTWTRISLALKTNNSQSVSVTATVFTENRDAVEICYEYLNEPRADGKISLHAHRGTTRLVLSSDCQAFQGEYYTGRDRQTYGVLNFTRMIEGSQEGK